MIHILSINKAKTCFSYCPCDYHRWLSHPVRVSTYLCFSTWTTNHDSSNMHFVRDTHRTNTQKGLNILTCAGTHTHTQTNICVPSDSFSQSKVEAKNRSLLQPLRASLVVLSCVRRGQCDVCNWIFAAHILKASVSEELKATHWLTGSLTDKVFGSLVCCIDRFVSICIFSFVDCDTLCSQIGVQS